MSFMIFAIDIQSSISLPVYRSIPYPTATFRDHLYPCQNLFLDYVNIDHELLSTRFRRDCQSASAIKACVRIDPTQTIRFLAQPFINGILIVRQIRIESR